MKRKTLATGSLVLVSLLGLAFLAGSTSGQQDYNLVTPGGWLPLNTSDSIRYVNPEKVTYITTYGETMRINFQVSSSFIDVPNSSKNRKSLGLE